MQVASLINVLASSPAMLALNAAAGGTAGALGTGDVQNTGALTDALLTQAPGQFAGLLTGTNIKAASLPVDALATDNTSTDIKDTSSPGDVATLPQNSGIAIPPIGLYIDQTPIKNVVLTQDDAIGSATSGKKLVFDNEDKSGPLLANEVTDKKDGKVKLAGIDTDKANDPEFSKAFANIMQQGKEKTLAKTDIQAKVVDAKTDFINNKTATADKAVATNALVQPQAIAGKIAARILGVKEDKISVDGESTSTAEMATRLQELDAQLRAKNYTQIKAVTNTLAQSPVDQVQLKITQALNSNLNTIKINLHPAELGAVDVDMDVDHEGNTKIRIIADKAETLQLLKQDSQHLVKSLSEIGVKADAGSLQFSLRGDGQGQQDFANAQNGSGNNNNQTNQQQAAAVAGNYSRFSNINEQDLILSINNKALNILV